MPDDGIKSHDAMQLIPNRIPAGLPAGLASAGAFLTWMPMFAFFVQGRPGPGLLLTLSASTLTAVGIFLSA